MHNAYNADKIAFQKYEKAHCDFYASLAKGDVSASDLRSACVAELNGARAEQLEWALKRW
jgi:hypothetical protein